VSKPPKIQPTAGLGGTRGPYGAACLGAKRPIDMLSHLIPTFKNQPFLGEKRLIFMRAYGNPLQLKKIKSTVFINRALVEEEKRLIVKTGVSWCTGARCLKKGF
jgi:Tfp pilus assembly protein PilZ